MPEKSKRPCDNITDEQEIDYILDLIASGYPHYDVAAIFVNNHPHYLEKAEARGFSETTLIKHIEGRIRFIKSRHRKELEAKYNDIKSSNINVSFRFLIESKISFTVYDTLKKYAIKYIESFEDRDIGADEIKMLLSAVKLIKLVDDFIFKYVKEMTKIQKDELSGKPAYAYDDDDTSTLHDFADERVVDPAAEKVYRRMLREKEQEQKQHFQKYREEDKVYQTQS